VQAAGGGSAVTWPEPVPDADYLAG
jgi:hypothetical protein